MAEPNAMETASEYLTQAGGDAVAELQKLAHSPWELATRATKPVLGPLMFREVMARVQGFTVAARLDLRMAM